MTLRRTQTERQLERIELSVRQLLIQGALNMAALDDLRTEVQEMRGVVESAKTALERIAGMIRKDAADEDAMRELAADLDAQAAGLAAAVASSKPAEPEEPAPEPEPEPEEPAEPAPAPEEPTA